MLKHTFQQPVVPERVLVIGANGFIGGAVTALFKKIGVPVCAITRRDVDLLDEHAASRLEAYVRPGDVVVASAGIAPCKDLTAFQANMKLSLTLAKIARHSDIAHFVNIGSDAIYADHQMPLTEGSETAPTTLYGTMHLLREVLIREYAAAPVAFLRLTAVYGAEDHLNTYGPNRFRRNVQDNEPVVLFGAGEELRDHVYIDDVTKIIQLVLQHRSFGVLNIATGAITSFREIAEMIVRASAKAVSIKESPRSEPMPYNGFRPFDNAATRQAFSDFSYTSLSDGLTLSQKKMNFRVPPKRSIGKFSQTGNMAKP